MDVREVKDKDAEWAWFVADTGFASEVTSATSACDTPVAGGVGGLEGLRIARGVDLDLVETLVFETVGVEEKDGLVDAEDEDGGGDGGVSVMIREAEAKGGGDGGDALNAVKGHEENVINDVETHGCADANFGRDKKGEPEGEHSCGEVDERGAPVVVEDAGRDNNVPDGGDNDGGKSGFGNPVERRAELENGEYDNGASNDTIGG